jgi:hypothetical protein
MGITRRLAATALGIALLAGCGSAKTPAAEMVKTAIGSHLNVPSRCARANISFAQNQRWAAADLRFSASAGCPVRQNETVFLKKTAKWAVVFQGSDAPPCSLGIPRSFTPCARPQATQDIASFTTNDCLRRWNRLDYGSILPIPEPTIHEVSVSVVSMQDRVCAYEGPLNNDAGYAYAYFLIVEGGDQSPTDIVRNEPILETDGPSRTYSPSYQMTQGRIREH